MFKAFLSSPVALRSTIQRRLHTLESAEPQPTPPAGVRDESAALRTLDELAARAEQDGPAKLHGLLHHLGALGIDKQSDTRVVVFSERIQTLFWLQERLRHQLGMSDRQVAVLHAQLPDTDLQQVVEDFALEGSPVRILLASDMASEGLNLHQQCHQLVHYDLPWSFIRIQQRNGRIDRYGQLHQPQITALALSSDDDDVISDVRVVTRLLGKEHAANQALGDAGVLMDLHDEDLEEQTVRRHLQQQEEIDDFVPDPDPAQLNPFAQLMTTGGEHQQESAPEVMAPRTLFDDDDNFLAEALDELTAQDPSLASSYAIHRTEDDDLVAFNTPSDLVARLADLPAEYLREQQVADRIRLTGSRQYAEQRLAAARRSDDTSWPDVHFLGPQHPVLEWVTDRALARLGRNEAPVLSGKVEEPVFLTQAVWSNALGQPVVSHWGAVHGVPDAPAVTPLVETLQQAGVREGAVNTGHAADRLAELQPRVPAAVAAARADLEQRRTHVEDALLARLDQARDKVKQWHQEALDITDGATTTALTKSRRETIEHDTQELTGLIDSLAAAGEPFVRVVGVIVPEEG